MVRFLLAGLLSLLPLEELHVWSCRTIQFKGLSATLMKWGWVTIRAPPKLDVSLLWIDPDPSPVLYQLAVHAGKIWWNPCLHPKRQLCRRCSSDIFLHSNATIFDHFSRADFWFVRRAFNRLLQPLARCNTAPMWSDFDWYVMHRCAQFLIPLGTKASHCSSCYKLNAGPATARSSITSLCLKYEPYHIVFQMP